MVEFRTVNAAVAGSSPAPGAIVRYMSTDGKLAVNQCSSERWGSTP